MAWPPKIFQGRPGSSGLPMQRPVSDRKRTFIQQVILTHSDWLHHYSAVQLVDRAEELFEEIEKRCSRE